jgi:hypothetical protein
LPATVQPDIGLAASARRASADQVCVTVRTEKFAQAVRLDIPTGEAADQYFHVPPHSSREIAISVPRELETASFRGTVSSLNCSAVRRIEVALQ